MGESRPSADGLPPQLRAHFREAIQHFRLAGSPFNARLAAGCVADDGLLRLAACTPPGQPPSYLLFGVVHHLLLGRPQTELGRYYPSLHHRPLPIDGLVPAFRQFCREREAELSLALLRRPLQFTVVARAAHVFAAVAEIAKQEKAPLNLIDVGSSAGLLTRFDRYRYEFGSAGCYGPTTSPVVCRCTFRHLPPVTEVRLDRRVGVDLERVDLSDLSQRRWFEALLPPDWAEPRAQLSAALDLSRAVPVEQHTGDVLDLLPGLLEGMPDPVCVLHAHCLYQWPAPLHAAFDLLLREGSRGRVVHRLSLESRGLFPALVPAYPGGTPDAETSHETIHCVYKDGERVARRLAVNDAFGRSAIWMPV